MTKTLKRKLALAVGLVAVTGLSVGAYYARRGEPLPEVVTATVSRGPIVTVVSSTGTLDALTMVQVGTQVSGTVQMLNADFNSIVKKGQLLAKLDPSLYQTQVESARANLVRAEADVERLKVASADAQVKAQRARELASRQLIPATDLETAEVEVRSAAAQQRSAEAQVAQARAALMQAQVNLDKTIITSPIDGIVVSRSVDVGQTVAASLQAPTLFTIAADLAEMQVKANIDESDLGVVTAGQTATFTVDAYPGQEFKGTITQVRLNPVVEQNVVTYAAIIAAPNPELKLKPGMTANISVEVARRDDVLRVATAAMRFRPTEATLAAFGQADPSPSVSGQNPTQAAGAQRQQGHTATLWLFDGEFHPVTVRTGVSDGINMEIVDGAVAEGTQVATRVVQSTAAHSASPSTSTSPLIPTMRRR